MSASSPIADLTYRGYDGPMTDTDRRWWAIAKMTMRLGIKRKGFWVWASISAWGYILLMAIFYFADIAAANSGQAKNPILSGIIWKNQVLIGYSQAQLMLFFLAMLIGIGQIANDNRANALLIYLSKPCTKMDYLAGKWLGIFVPLYLVTLVPILVFWAYLAMSFREYGSVSSAPFLPFQLVLVCAVPAFLLSSMCVGISSLFKEGRLAGLTFAGAYFVTNVFTHLMAGLYTFGDQHLPIVRNLFYASIDGLNIGMAKLLCATDGSQPFAQGAQQAPSIARPDIAFVGIAYFGLSALCILVAWLRIRPVEVIG